ncbi:hypothetical protein JY97_10955 [Alkalispirochaeta odontotermitis]|nr:hypothetical protein JY97_10955 [Alkalispirochaeta odontotermitis]
MFMGGLITNDRHDVTYLQFRRIRRRKNLAGTSDPRNGSIKEILFILPFPIDGCFIFHAVGSNSGRHLDFHRISGIATPPDPFRHRQLLRFGRGINAKDFGHETNE